MARLPKLIDCFCGAGGLSLGFRTAGFEIVYAFDNDETSIETYRRNIGEHGFVEDVRSVNRAKIESQLGARISEVDVIAGGPPCQGFSVQRRGSDLDARNELVIEFARLISELRPKFFLMENVGGLLAPRGREVMQDFRQMLESSGYYLHFAKLDSSKFDVPQVRKRVFVVGERTNSKRPFPTFEFPSPPNQIKIQTVRDAIADLQDKSEEDVPNHRADKLSDINLQRIRSISEGQGRDSMPEHLWLNCHRSNNDHRHLDVYGRMSWDRPAPTITARFDSFSRGRFGHPILDRTITLREGARLQTFPDNFVFSGSKVEIARQIGNAVPPKLAEIVALEILKRVV